MSSFKNMGIAPAVAANPNIIVKSGFLGLNTRVYYRPTFARVKSIRDYYTVESGHFLQQFLTKFQNDPNSATKIPELDLETNPNGNYCLEICASVDSQFVALQLLRFSDLAYNPITDLMVYEGPEAEMLCRVLRK